MLHQLILLVGGGAGGQYPGNTGTLNGGSGGGRVVNLEDTAQLLVNQHQLCMELLLDMEMLVMVVLTGAMTTV